MCHSTLSLKVNVKNQNSKLGGESVNFHILLYSYIYLELGQALSEEDTSSFLLNYLNKLIHFLSLKFH